VTSPVRYLNKKIRPGGMKGSIFNLICGVLGTGMLTLPVVCQINGIIFGSILIALGGFITIFWGMCIVTCSEKTDSDSLEYIAHIAFGEFIRNVTSFCMIMWLLGYVTSYIVIIKSLLPFWLERLMKDSLPAFLADEFKGQLFIATVYTFVFLIPLSLPRSIGALRFTSLFGFIWCLFLVIVIVMVFIFSRVIVPDPMENINHATYFKFSVSGIFTTFPFIISSYMYQPMIPAIYKNLERASFRRMEKVVLRGSYGAVFLYMLIAVFGYLIFSQDNDEMIILNEKQDIMEKNFYFEIAITALVFTVMTTGPLWIVPWKDTWEDLFYGDWIMTDVQNTLVTLLLVFIWYFWAIFIPSIGDVLMVLGLTCNPFIGFFLPLLCYLKLDPDCSMVMKVTSLLILFLTIVMVLVGSWSYILTFIN
jgi:amino acid permease